MTCCLLCWQSSTPASGHGAALLGRVCVFSYLIVVDDPVWQCLLLLGSAVGWAASVGARIVTTTTVYISETRWHTRVLNSHLWCLVSIAFDISQGLLLVESLVVQRDLQTRVTTSLPPGRWMGTEGVSCYLSRSLSENPVQNRETEGGIKIPQTQLCHAS